MKQSHALALLGGLSAALSPLPAQGPDDVGARTATTVVQAPLRPDQGPVTQGGAAMADALTPIHTMADDQGLAYGTWAAGRDYKVSFHDGMTFVPYLGADYPTTQSLHWQTTSARLGEQELLTDRPPEAKGADYRYEYRFGTLTEAYDVRLEGLEQTFVLHQRPAAGDLVIRGAITSALKADPAAAAQQPLTFRDAEGRAIVSYGHAIAYDAHGQRTPVTTAGAAGTITLTVPGAWLANAALPVTVDPMLSPVVVGSWGATGGDVATVDIARDDLAVTANVMVVYTRAASTTDHDLYARLCNDDFTNTTTVFTDVTTSWSTDQGSAAFVGGTDQWVVVMRRYFNASTPTASLLRAHQHASGDATLQTNLAYFGGAAGINDWRPDVGGVEAYSTGNDALVVFERENNGAGNPFANSNLSEVAGVLFDTTTSPGAFGTAFTIHPSSVHDCERPSVTQVADGGTSFSWVCVYQAFLDGVTNEDWDLNGVRIDQNGTVATGTWISHFALATPMVHQLGPVVEGQSGRYAVLFTTLDVATYNFKTALISGQQLYVERFDWANGAASPSNQQDPVLLRSNTDRRWEASGLGFDTNDRSHWTATYRAISPGVPAAYYDRVGYTGNLTEWGTLYYTSGHVPTGVACTFDNDNDTFLCAYGVFDGISQPVYGQVTNYDGPAATATYGVPCGFANPYWYGNQQIGAEFNSLMVTGSPTNALHLMVAATAAIDTPLIIPGLIGAGCSLYVPISGPYYLGMFPTAVGSSVSWYLALPEALANQTLYFQDWYLDPTTLLLYNSVRLAVPIVK